MNLRPPGYENCTHLRKLFVFVRSDALPSQQPEVNLCQLYKIVPAVVNRAFTFWGQFWGQRFRDCEIALIPILPITEICNRPAGVVRGTGIQKQGALQNFILKRALSRFILHPHTKKIAGRVLYCNPINLVEDQIFPLFLIHRRMRFYTHKSILDIFFC